MHDFTSSSCARTQSPSLRNHTPTHALSHPQSPTPIRHSQAAQSPWQDSQCSSCSGGGGGEGGGRRRQVILLQANRGCRLDSPRSSPRHSYWRTQNSTGASGEQRQGRTRPRPLPAAAARPPIAHVWPRAGREPSASLRRPRTVPALLSLSQLLPRVWWLSCPAWLCDGLARWHLSGGDHPEFRREAVQQSAGARTGSGILRDQEAARSSGRSLIGVWVWPFRGRGRREVGRGQDRGVCRGAECGLPGVGRGHSKAGSDLSGWAPG